MSVKMTVLAENGVPMGMGLIGEHGWSALLESDDKKVLFDCGQGMCLNNNPRLLGLNLSKLDVIALSHGHFDHSRGLPVALEACGGTQVVCHPACFEKKMVRHKIGDNEITLSIGMPASQANLEKQGASFLFTTDKQEIAPGLTLITEIPMVSDFEDIEDGFFIQTDDGEKDDSFADDASLVVQGDMGVSVILGCAHRGMINSIERAKQVAGVSEIYSVWGGTHLIQRDPEQIEKTIQALESVNIQKVGTAHCTGDQVAATLCRHFGRRFEFAHVGMKVEL